jgi:hypothetical protein
MVQLKTLFWTFFVKIGNRFVFSVVVASQYPTDAKYADLRFGFEMNLTYRRCNLVNNRLLVVLAKKHAFRHSSRLYFHQIVFSIIFSDFSTFWNIEQTFFSVCEFNIFLISLLKANREFVKKKSYLWKIVLIQSRPFVSLQITESLCIWFVTNMQENV